MGRFLDEPQTKGRNLLENTSSVGGKGRNLLDSGQSTPTKTDLSVKSPSLALSGPISRGIQATDRGFKKEDVPFSVANIVSGALGGVPEAVARNPLAAFTQAGSDLVTGRERDLSVFPEAATPEGESLGRQLGFVSGFSTGIPIAGRGASAVKAGAKSKLSKSAFGKATSEAPEFAKGVRDQFFKAQRAIGEKFEKQISSIEKANPNAKVSLREPVERLIAEQIENPKLASGIKSAIRKSGDNLLSSIIENPDLADNLTLSQAQALKQSIKKIPGLSRKLSQGKFAQFDDTDIPLLDFLDDIRSSELESFPELKNAFKEFSQQRAKFDLVKNKFKQGALTSNIRRGFGDPEIEKAVSEILPERTLSDIKNVGRASRTLAQSRNLARQLAPIAGAGLVGGGIVSALT